MCKVSSNSPSSSNNSAANRIILFTRPVFGPCGVAGAPPPPPPAAEPPISGSAADEEPQHHCGATSGSEISIFRGKKKKNIDAGMKRRDKSPGRLIVFLKMKPVYLSDNGSEIRIHEKFCGGAQVKGLMYGHSSRSADISHLNKKVAHYK